MFHSLIRKLEIKEDPCRWVKQPVSCSLCFGRVNANFVPIIPIKNLSHKWIAITTFYITHGFLPLSIGTHTWDFHSIQADWLKRGNLFKPTLVRHLPHHCTSLTLCTHLAFSQSTSHCRVYCNICCSILSVVPWVGDDWTFADCALEAARRVKWLHMKLGVSRRLV